MVGKSLLAVTAIPLLAQQGCAQEDIVGLVTVLLQTLVTSLLPVLVNGLVGGTGLMV
ncbi:MAG: hypothetical protein JXQ73_13300 [Phycisphaerae bacterium]|nr:hypothetical protein [Phycisphaerae bacterium]